MDGDGIGQLQFLQLLEAVLDHFPLVKFHRHGLGKFIDLPDDSHIPVEHAASLIQGNAVPIPYLPGHLIVVLDLHDLIPFPVDAAAGFPLFFGGRGRI